MPDDLVRDEYDIKGRLADASNAFNQYAQRVRDLSRLVAELQHEKALLLARITALEGSRDE